MARTKGKREEGPFTNIGAAKTLAGRWGEGAKGTPKTRASWHDVSPVIVHTLVSLVGELGGAVTLGVDKSGAGFTVAVWVSGEKVFNRWFRGDDDGINALEEEAQAFTDDVRALLSGQ